MTEAKTGRETWRDWLPANVADVRLITRAELLDQLARGGQRVTSRQLRYWEDSGGALPAPLVQSHEGKVQAMYPSWYADVVAVVALRHKQEHLSLAELRPFARERIQELNRMHTPKWATWTSDNMPPLPPALVRDLASFAARLNEFMGQQYRSVDLEFRAGRLTTAYTLFLTGPNDKNEAKSR